MGRIRPNLRLATSRTLCCALIAPVVAVMVPVGVPAAQAAPATYWVDHVTGDATHPGTQAEPFFSIKQASEVAGPADTIMVLPGTYNGGSGETFPITLNGASLVSVAGSASTTISGGSTNKQILQIDGWGAGDRLQGFTIRDGGVSGGLAAVVVPLSAATSAATSPAITDCNFRYNQGHTGGALCVFGGAGTNLRISGCTFSGGTANRGGGMYADSEGNLVISGNEFMTNSAFYGGAINISTGTTGIAVIEDNGFYMNTATESGGAILWENESMSNHQTLRGNDFSANQASLHGGCIYLWKLTLAAQRNDAGGNAATSAGGFAYLQDASVIASNNYLAQNSAGWSGAAWRVDAASSLNETNDTVVACTGGYPVHAETAGTLNVLNCIYWNTGVTSQFINADSLAYTCSADDAATLAANSNAVGAGMVYADPQFNGDDLPAVLDTSPCIETGSSAQSPSPDFFGTPRPQDFDGDRIAVPDIGCYEAPGVPLPTYSPIFRFYNVRNGTHFYTDSASERDHVIATWPTIYSFEGVAYYTYPANNTQPLTRLYNKMSGSHFYTASPAEAANALAKWPTVFSLDGLTYAVNPAPVPWSSPVYRFYNKKNGSHFYTASAEEADAVKAKWPDVYQYEGPAFWIGQ